MSLAMLLVYVIKSALGRSRMFASIFWLSKNVSVRTDLVAAWRDLSQQEKPVSSQVELISNMSAVDGAGKCAA